MQLKASLGYMRLSKRICKYLCDSPILFSPMAAIAPPWTVCELYCKGLPGGASKAEEVPSPACLCSPQAIPASPLSSPTPTSVQYALPVGSPGTVLSLPPLSLTPSSSLPVVKKKSHGTSLPLLFLLLNPFCKLQTSCVLLIRTRDPGSSAHVVWCLTIQVQCPLGTNQWGLSLQRSRQMYAAQVPAPPVTPLFEICNKSLIRTARLR